MSQLMAVLTVGTWKAGRLWRLSHGLELPTPRVQRLSELGTSPTGHNLVSFTDHLRVINPESKENLFCTEGKNTHKPTTALLTCKTL